MPYRVEYKDKGFVVKHGNKAFSKKPLPLKKAIAQRTAIILSELRRKKSNKK